MPTARLAIANPRYPSTPDESVAIACRMIADAGAAGADIVCFPEEFIPGYRGLGHVPPPPDPAFLERAWATVADAARAANVAVVLGTERVAVDGLRITTLVIDRDGSTLGWQDKVQLDPSEEAGFVAGHGRRTFTVGDVTFGVAICHEGWRYPEVTRWAARHGAQVVFVPHLHEAEGESHRPTTFGEAATSFHEKALLCRAAENTIFVAGCNYATDGAPSTATVVKPDGTVQAYHPYGVEGLLVADVDLSLATRLLAKRYKPIVD